MRQAKVLRNGEEVGTLTKMNAKEYTFSYNPDWFANPKKPPISLTLPKSNMIHHADHLFPFFFNMISEGVNLKLQARQYQVDESDYFNLLLLTAQKDTIGPITLEPIE